MTEERVRRSMDVLVRVIVVCVAIMVLTMLATVLYVHDANATRRDEQVATCERGNMARVRINALVADAGLDFPKLKILDCPTVIH